jgi:hypothetical protein
VCAVTDSVQESPTHSGYRSSGNLDDSNDDDDEPAHAHTASASSSDTRSPRRSKCDIALCARECALTMCRVA